MKMLKVIAAVVLLNAAGAMFGTPKAPKYDKYKTVDLDKRIGYIKKNEPDSSYKNQKIKLFQKLKNLQQEIHRADVGGMGFSPNFNFDKWDQQWLSTEKELEKLEKSQGKNY